MPTATSFENFSLLNLCPLTTTYSAPASCSTGTDRVQVALATAPNSPLWYPSCQGLKVSDCVPSGTARDALLPTFSTNPGLAIVEYHSPGVVCPANWATVGVVAKASDGSFNSTGVFSRPPTTASPTYHRPGTFVELGLNVLMNAIDAGETAVVCCPR